MQTSPDIVKTFNEFQYPAMVDLIKETLTLAVGTLVLSQLQQDKEVDCRTNVVDLGCRNRVWLFRFAIYACCGKPY